MSNLAYNDEFDAEPVLSPGKIGGPGAWRIVDVLRPPVDSSQGSPGAEGREGRKASGDGPGPGQR